MTFRVFHKPLDKNRTEDNPRGAVKYDFLGLEQLQVMEHDLKTDNWPPATDPRFLKPARNESVGGKKRLEKKNTVAVLNEITGLSCDIIVHNGTVMTVILQNPKHLLTRN